MTVKIVIEVNGGVVQEVYSDDPEVVIVLVDWDTEGCEPGKEAYVVHDELGHEHLAFAEVVRPTPMEMLPTETRLAVELAQS